MIKPLVSKKKELCLLQTMRLFLALPARLHLDVSDIFALPLYGFNFEPCSRLSRLKSSLRRSGVSYVLSCLLLALTLVACCLSYLISSLALTSQRPSCPATSSPPYSSSSSVSSFSSSSSSLICCMLMLMLMLMLTSTSFLSLRLPLWDYHVTPHDLSYSSFSHVG